MEENVAEFMAGNACDREYVLNVMAWEIYSRHGASSVPMAFQWAVDFMAHVDASYGRKP